MEVVSLHPLDLEVVRRYVATLEGAPAEPSWNGWFSDGLRADLTRAKGGDERAANRITLGLAFALGQSAPIFTGKAFGLSFWEAQVDRPIGMLMRPPSRLFMDAGLDGTVAREMPIRIDMLHGMMGGAWIPARLIGQAHTLMEEHMERSVKRLVAAEYDPMSSFGLMYEAVTYARDHGVGLYEAADVVGPDGQGMAGFSIIQPNRKRLDPDIARRIMAYQAPPKKPGLVQRLFSRSAPPISANGRHPDSEG